MRYEQFWAGDKVITLLDYTDTTRGSLGTVIKKWAGTGYIVRLPDNSFVWLDSSEFGSHDPERGFKLNKGDIGVVTSGHHNHPFAQVGDKFKVYKVIEDVDYYEVLINNEVRFLVGAMLAHDV